MSNAVLFNHSISHDLGVVYQWHDLVGEVRLSASMLSLVERCPRRAGYQYASEYSARRVQSRSQQLGDKYHAAFDRYHKTGQSPEPNTEDEDSIEISRGFRSALPHIPRPHTGLSESKQELMVGGVLYTIRPDWQGKGRHLGTTQYPANLDFKTSRNPLEYGLGLALDKNPKKDIQVILYSAHLQVKTRADAVLNRWLYIKTGLKKPKIYPSDFFLTKEEINQGFANIVWPLSKTMLNILQDRPDPNTLPANTGACYDFHRVCPYAEENGGPCRVSNSERLKGTKMGLLDQIHGGASAPSQQPDPKEAQAPAQAATGARVAQAQAINPPPSEPEARAAKAAHTNRDALANRIGLAILDLLDYVKLGS